MKKQELLIIGNGMVGHHLITTYREKGAETFNITVIGAERRPAYDRVHLSEFFSGKTEEDLSLSTAAEYFAQGIDLHLGDPAEIIDSTARTVTTQAGKIFTFDKLILATGSYPFVPPIAGSDHHKCLVYRTLDDLDLIAAQAKTATRGVVIGGGLLGLECANALKNLGLETHVVEFSPGLMGVQLDGQGSQTLRHQIESLDVQVHTKKSTQNISENPNGSLKLEFVDDALDTDMVVFSAGIRPSDQIARDAGLNVGERGGIVVNECCETSAPNIYAVGECALFDERIFGLVAPGYRMAEVAIDQLLGGNATFNGADMSTKLKLLGVEVGSIGDAHGNAAGTQSIVLSNPVKQTYFRLNLNQSLTEITGAVLVGDTSAFDTVLQYHLNKIKLPASPESLILPTPDGESGLTADMLPNAATICSCHNVTKGDVMQSVDGGSQTLIALKTDTKASTGCGGCAALLKTVFEAELESRGIAVDRSLCEHFSQTRQGLFHLCKMEDIRDFKTLIQQHGAGHGCEICKPTAASIFASLYNEPVLNKAHVGLQDTNDHSLANMQKNGTYSVVPRIPGGEITPDRLIVIGEVAKEFDLYTKITGGQRIDLFGAELHELPLIWKKLIDAGFETGHAYGKALRTVKSCVGSTWCRYGVQDSVAMALFVENRYKGLRSPHKLKMGVSGCTRECAEAQSKDVGIIATENGWNLFVGGNGGMRPRHADLFATDLNNETLVKYIDRILMFYVSTADRLQRTSVWLESLEGGLDYLKSVVIDDELGINQELEDQMQNIIGTYHCEWKNAIEDPEQLKRFRQFVNTNESDPGIRFVRERDQLRPAKESELIAVAK